MNWRIMCILLVTMCSCLASATPDEDDPFICGEQPQGGYWTSGIPDTLKAAIIYICFPETPELYGVIDNNRRNTVPNAFKSFIERQSRSQHILDVDIIYTPNDTTSMWEATHSAETYAFRSSILPISQYYSSWDSLDSEFGHFGELQAEILWKIWDAYSEQSNPFDDIDLLYFISAGRSLHGTNIHEYIGGYGHTSIITDKFPFLIEAGFPDDYRVNGIYYKWENPANTYVAKMIFAHEYGHKIGLWHSPGNYDLSIDNYFYGPYSGMRCTVIPKVGCVPYHYLDLNQLGWYSDPINVATNMKRTAIYDIRDGGYTYKIDLSQFGASGQYLLLEYHSGIAEDAELDAYNEPIYKSQGLCIWHIYGNVWDLESAWGLYSDPGPVNDTQYWHSVNDSIGFDNHDIWPWNTGAPQDSIDAYYTLRHDYRGSSRDFFSIANGTSEYSYKSNPNTYGYHSSNRRSPQNRFNSVVVDILEDHGDYLVVDLLLAPYEDILTPIGGEQYVVGDTITITWSDEHPIISTVDILLSKDGGVTYPVTIVQGASASMHNYEWVPTDSVATDSAIIKVVYHNTNSNYTCDDVSDTTFTILPEPVVRYVNKSTSTNLNYDGTPYSSVVLDYNHDGKTDLFVSVKNDDSMLYQATGMTGDGVPYFVDATQASFGLTMPQAGLRGVSVADIDNDGDDELFAAANSNARLYSSYCDSNQVWKFADVATDVGLTAYATDTWSGTWGDYDQDGDVDLYVTRAQTYGGSQTPDALNVIPLRDYLLKNNMNINGQFVDASSAAGGMSTSVMATITASWADIDNDGDLDLLVPSIMDYNGYETARLYTNSGNGTFTQNYTSRFGDPGLWHISGMSWFDADNDADLDVAFSSQPPSGYGNNQRVFINDAGYFTEEGIGLYLHAAGVNAFDYDLDGQMDLLYSPMSNVDTPHLLQNISSSNGFECYDVTNKSGIANVGRVDGVVVSDFNRGGADTDGDLDLFLGRPESSGEYFFRASNRSDLSDSPANHSVSVKLFSGGPNNASAIGARVVASYNGMNQVQQVDGGSGHGGQNDRILTFGLGDYDGIVNLAIKWPQGYTQYETVPADSLDTGRPVEYEDETPVVVTTNSLQVSFVHLPGDYKMEWTITWDTNVNSKRTLDTVEITGPGWPSSWVVAPGNSQITPKAGGGFTHSIVISDFDCAPGYYTFRARSSTDAVTGAWSSPKTKRVTNCISEI